MFVEEVMLFRQIFPDDFQAFFNKLTCNFVNSSRALQNSSAIFCPESYWNAQISAHAIVFSRDFELEILCFLVLLLESTCFMHALSMEFLQASACG